tara:strand:+ start:67 stop:636 length:570 start_codon:yes stop_codon:yes gene_type:complete
MVSVKGQLEESPLVDIGAIKQEYWQRKEVLLPSLAKLTPKKKGWFGRSKPQTPKLIIKRLTEQEWREIDERFYNEKADLLKHKTLLTKLSNKLLNGKSLSKDEYRIINSGQSKAMPIYKGMLEVMIEEPQMKYEEVSAMMDILDDYDRNTLMAYVNLLTSQKAEAAKRVLDERNDELSKLNSKMGVPNF